MTVPPTIAPATPPTSIEPSVPRGWNTPAATTFSPSPIARCASSTSDASLMCPVSSSTGAKPSVNGQNLACDVAGVVGQEKDHRRGDLVGRALPAERHRRLRPVGTAGGGETAERRIDQAGRHDV